MMELLEKYFDTVFSIEEGIRRLRELILSLAFNGDFSKELESSPLGVREVESKVAESVFPHSISYSKGRNDKEGTNPKLKDLPLGWRWCQLREISSYNGRNNISSKDIDANTWVLDLEDIEKDTSRLLKRGLFKDKQSLSTKSTFKKGDVLYGKLRPYLNKVIIADMDGVCTTEIVPIVPGSGVDSEFLCLLLKRPQFLEYVNSLMYGVKMPRLGTSDAQDSFHPIPPFKEQKRLVRLIKDLFSRCDELEKLRAARDQQRLDVHAAAIRRLLDAPDPAAFDEAWQFIARHFGDLYAVCENVAGLRKAILQLAVMGRLVPQDAREGTGYNEGQQRSGQSSGEDLEIPIPPSWKLAKVEDLIISIDSGWSPACKPTPAGEGEWGVLKTTAVQPLRFLPHENKALPSNLKPRPAIVPDEGDILITRAGPKNRVGICCVVKKSSPKLMLSDKIVRMKLLQKIVDPDYMALGLSVGMGADQVEDAKSGMAESQMNISQDKIRRITILVPPIKEQRRIIQKAERLLTLCDELEHQIAAAELKQDEVLGAVVNQNTL